MNRRAFIRSVLAGLGGQMVLTSLPGSKDWGRVEAVSSLPANLARMLPESGIEIQWFWWMKPQDAAEGVAEVCWRYKDGPLIREQYATVGECPTIHLFGNTAISFNHDGQPPCLEQLTPEQKQAQSRLLPGLPHERRKLFDQYLQGDALLGLNGEAAQYAFTDFGF